MVKGRLLAGATVLSLLVLAATVGASAQTATLGVLVNQILALFPRVDGEVLEVQGTTVTLSIGQRDGLVAGVELTAYREGRELRHPKTGEILGHTEEVVGKVAVRQVQEAYSTGAVVEGTAIRPGDKVRVSAGKIKLTLLPIVEGVKNDLAEAATYELIEALNRTGRFQIALGDAGSRARRCSRARDSRRLGCGTKSRACSSSPLAGCRGSRTWTCASSLSPGRTRS